MVIKRGKNFGEKIKTSKVGIGEDPNIKRGSGNGFWGKKTWGQKVRTLLRRPHNQVLKALGFKS